MTYRYQSNLPDITSELPNEFERLQKRRDDWLGIEDRDPRKNYLDGKLDLLVDFADRRTGIEWNAFFTTLPMRAPSKTAMGKLHQLFPNGRIFQCRVGSCEEDLLDNPQGITAPSFIGLKTKDEWPENGIKSFYFSPATAIFKTALAPHRRKSEIGRVDTTEARGLPHQIIEPMPKIAGDLQSETVAIPRNGAGGHKSDDLLEMLSELDIILNSDRAHLIFRGLGKLLIEVHDVFMGPVYE